MMIIAFWSLLLLIAYTYVLFPALVLLRGWLWPREYRQAANEPTVSVIIAAYNEQSCIGRKIENVLALEYPSEKLELIIASDGSTDGTNEIVRGYLERNVRLLALPRSGKAQALNAAVAAARGDVLVFSDANSMFERHAIRALVAPLGDPSVGGVAGDQRYEKARRGDNGTCGERGYWNFDRWMKRAESRGGNVISATGAIYAIRRELFQPVPEGVTDDFVTSTRVIAQGKRLVFRDDAIAWEPVAVRHGAEFGRKVRIMTRGLRGVWRMRCLLNPFQHGFYSLQLFSHKVLRRLMVLPLIGIVILSLLLWNESIGYRAFAVLQLTCLLLAAAGAVIAKTRLRQPKALAVPFYFCLVNFAALIALWRIITGQSVVLWQPQRSTGD